MTSATLWGREHVAYGDVAVRAPGARLAVALTRGLHPKPYRWTDPNEDVVAAVAGERAALLVVADGHNGAAASEVAVRGVLDAYGEDPPPADVGDRDLVRLFHDLSWAVLDATDCLDSERRESRTTLSLALVTGSAVQWAALGDSPVVVAGPGGAVEVTRAATDFLGWPYTPGHVHRLLKRGVVPLPDGAWVAVLSDGFSNFTGGLDTARAVGAVTSTAEGPEAAAAGLVRAALRGGAGDNVAAAVLAPEGN